MLDRRYQVFVTTSGEEMQAERALVVQTLVGMGFFAWGLESRTPLSSAYARRQIDDCDYVLLLLGSQYGEQSVSGIGYMHLEYIYALTKQKPIMVIMHQQPEQHQAGLLENTALQQQSPQLQEKFQQFRQQLQTDVEHVLLYQGLRDLELTVRSHMPQMLALYPSVGWVRPQNLQILQDEIDDLRVKLAQAKLQLDPSQNDPFLCLPKVSVNDIFAFDYRMNAYQEGNFKTLISIKNLTWLELLRRLALEFHQPMPEALFSKSINDYLQHTGLADAQRELPRAHSIARVQINIRALATIKQQMRQNEWIVPVGRDDRQRMLWQLTERGQQLLDDCE